MITYNLGTILDGKQVFRLREERLETGVGVLGTTGGGKSRFLWQLLREHRRNRRGFVLIDPGDLADDFLADCAREVIEKGNRGLLKKIHVLRLDPAQMARYDLFEPPDFGWVHPEVRPVYYAAWQHTAAMSRVEVFQGKAAGDTSLEGHPRVYRTMMNVFLAVSALVGGRRIRPSQGIALLDPSHPDHETAYRQVKSALPRDVRADFETLRGFKRLADVRAENEAGLNRLRSMLGPLMAEFLSGTGREPSFSLRRAVERGDYVFVSVKKTRYASHDQNVGLAKLIIHDWIEALQDCPRGKRRGSTLIIDEAHAYVSDELIRAQRVLRKYQGGLVLATQGLASLKKKDVDYAPDVLGLVNMLVSFRLTWPEDVKLVSRILFAGNIDHTPLEHDVYQNRGEVEWITVREQSVNAGAARNWSTADGTGASEQDSVQTSVTDQTQESWSDAEMTQAATGTAEGNNGGTTRGNSRGTKDSPIIEDGQVTRTLRLAGSQDTDNTTEGWSTTTNNTLTNGKTKTKGGGTSHAEATARGKTLGRQHSHTDNEGGAENLGVTVSEKLLPLPVIVHEKQNTGQLEAGPVEQQFEKYGQELTTLPRRRAKVRVGERAAFEIETAEVTDPFRSPEAQMKAVAWLLRELYRAHDYYFTPSVEEECRLTEGAADDHAGDGADEPVVVETASVEDDDPMG